MRARAAFVVSGLFVSACGGNSQSLSAPSALTTPTAPAPAPPGGGAAATYSVDMPVAAGESAGAAYGIWPFGVHGAGHALDGHPGFDVEFVPGAMVRAAADGTIQNAVPDSNTPGRFTIRINHSVGGRNYATDYTNVASLAPGISAGAAVTRGQTVGAAGVQTQFIGSSQVTWAMTHFQVNDFTRNEGLTNPNAVSPESFLSASGRGVFDAMWRTASYQTEWCEPLATGSRAASFPMARTWTLHSGSLAAQIDVRCVSDATRDYDYWWRAADQSVTETGTFQVSPTARPLATIDVRLASGALRLGVYDIVGDTMQLSVGAVGAPRPSSLSGASTYTTR